MPRATTGTTSRRRHKKVLGRAKGYRGRRSKSYKVAKQAVMKAGQYAYRDRRTRKRQMRAVWIARVNAAARQSGLTYRTLIHGLDKAEISLNRKVLADLALHNPAGFAKLADSAKAALEK